MNPWLGMALVLLLLVGLMLGLRWYKRRRSPHPELLRKLLHIGMGLTTLTFPWIFHDLWPVLLLAGLTAPLMLALRRSGRLKARLGGVIDGVDRRESLGEIYFPLAVAALFLFSGGDPLRYAIPILLLTLADAVAALIGVYYGRIYYTTAEGYKSAEGSLAFFIVAFFSAHIPLLLFSQVGRAEALLIALILGLLVMLIEAVAWRGLDNLFIPIGGFLLLNTFLDMTAVELAGRLVLTLVMVAFVLLWRNQANLQDNALLGAALVGYLSWTLADWRWFIGPFIIFMSHIVLSSGLSWFEFLPGRKTTGISLAGPDQAKTSQISANQKQEAAFLPSGNLPHYNIYGVVSVASGGALWLLLARLFERPELFYPFMAAFAIQLAILILVTLKHGYQAGSTGSLLGLSILRGWLLLFVPFILIQGLTIPILILALLALPVVAIAVFIFYRFQPVQEFFYPNDTARWLRQAGCAIVGSFIGLAILYLIERV